MPLAAVLPVNVICQRVPQGNRTVIYSCPDNNTCVNVQGQWKCRPPAVVLGLLQ